MECTYPCVVLNSTITKHIIWRFALTSRRLQVRYCPSWSVRATRSTLHNSWSHFYMHIISFQKSVLQICQVSRRICCLLSAPVSRRCCNCKCEGTRGDKHSCCATPNIHTATPRGVLSGDVPRSQAHRMHSRTATGSPSMEIVSRNFFIYLHMWWWNESTTHIQMH